MPNPAIGIIAITTPGATICAQHLVQVAAQKGLGTNHPEYLLYARPTQEYLTAIMQEDWDSISQLVIDAVKKLAGLNARLFIMPSNTPHYAWSLINEKVNRFNDNLAEPIVFLNLITATVEYCLKNNYKKVLLLGTTLTMQGGLYKRQLEAAGISIGIPQSDDITFIHEYIRQHLVKNEIITEKTNQLLDIINKLQKKENFDAVILGCTELPMILTNDSVSHYPDWDRKLKLVDTTYVLAERAVEMAMGCL